MKTINGLGVLGLNVVNGRQKTNEALWPESTHTRDPLHSTNPRGLGRVSDPHTVSTAHLLVAGPAALTVAGRKYEPDGIDPVYFQTHTYEQLSRGH